MASVDLRTRADYLHQPFWNHLLLACRFARLSRNRGPAHADDCVSFWPGWACRSGSVRTRRSAFAVLALCRCGVGRCFHGGLRLGALRRAMATLLYAEQRERNPRAPGELELPAPTTWPLVLASGFTLLFTGLLTSASVSILGAVLAVAGCVGWFREVFPHEREEFVPIVPETPSVTTSRRLIERLPFVEEQVRAWLPVETYPISAGVKGGLAGSVGVAALACIYGVVKAGSIWYPINLLAAAVYSQSLKIGPAQLNSFHADSFAIALVLHVVVSTLVGLLYGATLPMFARRPILLGGLIAPALWSGLLYSILGILNPLLESHIDWFWFMASQMAFGIIAGIVVLRQSRVPTRENLPFVLRAGIEAPGIMTPRRNGEERP